MIYWEYPPSDGLSYYRNMAMLAGQAAAMEQNGMREDAAHIFSRLGELAVEDTGLHVNMILLTTREQEEIAAKAELLQAYEQRFAEPVARLRASLEGPDAPEPLAVTSMARVYVITVDGEQYVVRFVEPQVESRYVDEADVWSPAYATNQYAHDLYKGRKIARDDIEYIAGIQYDEAVIVSRAQRGRGTGSRFDTERMRRVTGRQIFTLLEALEAIYNAGLDYDFSPGNLLYDSETGFSIVDYTYHDGHYETFEETVAECVGSCVELPRDREVSPEEYETRMALFDRFMAACRERYGQRPLWPRMLNFLERVRQYDIQSARVVDWDEAGRQGDLAVQRIEHHDNEGRSAEALLRSLAEMEYLLQEVERGLDGDVSRLQRALTILESALEGSLSPFAGQAQRQLALAYERLEIVIRQLEVAADETGQFREDL